MPPDPGNRSLLFAFAQERVQYYIHSKTDLGSGAVILRKRVLCSGVGGVFAEGLVYQAALAAHNSTAMYGQPGDIDDDPIDSLVVAGVVGERGCLEP